MWTFEHRCSVLVFHVAGALSCLNIRQSFGLKSRQAPSWLTLVELDAISYLYFIIIVLPYHMWLLMALVFSTRLIDEVRKAAVTAVSGVSWLV